MKLEINSIAKTEVSNDGAYDEGRGLETASADLLHELREGIEHAKAGKRNEARVLLMRVTETDPKNETAWLWLASISEYPEELLVFLQNVLSVNPENQRAIEWTKQTKSLLAKNFVQRGITAAQENQKDSARQCFLQAIAHDNQNEMAWLWLASIVEAAEEKVSHLQKVLNINPENEMALSSMKMVKTQMAQAILKKANQAVVVGDRETARNFVQEAMKHDATCEDGWLLKAHLADSFDEKVSYFHKVLELNPNNGAAIAGLTSVQAIMQSAVAPAKKQAAVTEERIEENIEEESVEDQVESFFKEEAHPQINENQGDEAFAREDSSLISESADLYSSPEENIVVEVTESDIQADGEFQGAGEAGFSEEAASVASEEAAVKPEEAHQWHPEKSAEEVDFGFRAEELEAHGFSPMAEDDMQQSFDFSHHPKEENAENPESKEDAQVAASEEAAVENSDSPMEESGETMKAESQDQSENEDSQKAAAELQVAPEVAEDNFLELEMDTPRNEAPHQADAQPEAKEAAQAETKDESGPEEVHAEAQEETAQEEIHAEAQEETAQEEVHAEAQEETAREEIHAEAQEETAQEKVHAEAQEEMPSEAQEEASAESKGEEKHEVGYYSYSHLKPEEIFSKQQLAEAKFEEIKAANGQALADQKMAEEAQEDKGPQEGHEVEETQEAAGFAEAGHQEEEMPAAAGEAEFSPDAEPQEEAMEAASEEAEKENQNPCAFCETENAPMASKCVSCYGIFKAVSIEQILSNDEADNEVIYAAIQKAESNKAAGAFSAADYANLGLAYLNVKDLYNSRENFDAALNLDPKNLQLTSFAASLAEKFEMQPAEEVIEEADDQEKAEKKEKPKKAKKASASTGHTIMVIDDSPTVRKLISSKLERHGHVVVSAVDGMDALAKINDITPDLILLDITMPRLDGYQVCKLIRNNDMTKEVPIVMISGKDGFFDKVRGRMAGSDGYVTKPFGPETLMKTLETYIQ